MDSHEITIRTWDRFAKAYHDRFMDLDIYLHTYAELCAVMDPRLPALEMGCGPGIITRHILAAHPGIRMLATDASAAMIELARQVVPGATYQQLDCRFMSSLEGTFGTVIAGFCLPYLDTAAARNWFCAIHEKLVPGGWLYLSFPGGNPETSGYHPAHDGGEGLYLYYYPEKVVRSWLSASGLYIEREWCIRMERDSNRSEEHYVYLARRTAPAELR